MLICLVKLQKHRVPPRLVDNQQNCEADCLLKPSADCSAVAFCPPTMGARLLGHPLPPRGKHWIAGQYSDLEQLHDMTETDGEYAVQ